MRLIDADAFQEDLGNRYCFPCMGTGKDRRGTACCACWVQDMVAEIEDAEKIEAVEVVRCKDCIYRNHVTQFCVLHSQEYDGGACWDKFPDDHYCSDGERRYEEDG